MVQDRHHITGSFSAWALASAAALLLTITAAASAMQDQAADDAGAQAFQAVCSKCHPPDRIVAARRTKTQWEETIDKMTKLGAPVTDDNYDVLLGYLVHHYGKVNVNRSTANDIAEAVGVTPEDAKKIVSYRDEHGPFADFDALAKVPGVDANKLEQNKDAITF